MLPHALSVAFFLGQVVGYVALSTVMQLVFYHLRQGREEEWKIQPGSKADLLSKANGSIEVQVRPVNKADCKLFATVQHAPIIKRQREHGFSILPFPASLFLIFLRIHPP